MIIKWAVNNDQHEMNEEREKWCLHHSACCGGSDVGHFESNCEQYLAENHLCLFYN